MLYSPFRNFAGITIFCNDVEYQVSFIELYFIRNKHLTQCSSTFIYSFTLRSSQLIMLRCFRCFPVSVKGFTNLFEYVTHLGSRKKMSIQDFLVIYKAFYATQYFNWAVFLLNCMVYSNCGEWNGCFIEREIFLVKHLPGIWIFFL